MLYITPLKFLGGGLRLIVPDLKFFVESYTLENQQGAGNGLNDLPGFNFNLLSGLGTKQSLNSVSNRLRRAFGNVGHLWMWDYASLASELKKVGFVDITEFSQGTAEDPMFLLPERDHQFSGSIGRYGLGVQAFKPL